MNSERLPAAPGPGDLPISLIVRTVRARWRFVVASAVLVSAVAAGLSTVRARRFEASVSVATVGTSRAATLGQGISAAFLSGTNTGLQATPALIGRILNSNAVASAVARAHSSGTSPKLIGQLLDPALGDHPTEAKLVGAVQHVSSVSVDRETGLISISVRVADSSLARMVVHRLVDEATALFQAASHAQAREVRVALEARVDSARRQMTAAEDALFAFASSNRANSPYSRAAVEEQRLERQVVIAQGVLVQALQEREAAIGKELEETPVLVVVEPLPVELPPIPRGTLMWIVLGAVVGVVGSLTWSTNEQMRFERRIALSTSP